MVEFVSICVVTSDGESKHSRSVDIGSNLHKLEYGIRFIISSLTYGSTSLLLTTRWWRKPQLSE